MFVYKSTMIQIFFFFTNIKLMQLHIFQYKRKNKEEK